MVQTKIYNRTIKKTKNIPTSIKMSIQNLHQNIVVNNFGKKICHLQKQQQSKLCEIILMTNNFIVFDSAFIFLRKAEKIVFSAVI